MMVSSLCLGMIFSENRFPLFRIMLEGKLDEAAVRPISGLDGSEFAALREESAAAIDAVYLI
jgi:hypothetical protein